MPFKVPECISEIEGPESDGELHVYESEIVLPNKVKILIPLLEEEKESAVLLMLLWDLCPEFIASTLGVEKSFVISLYEAYAVNVKDSVYAIKAGPFVKIGRTKDVLSRMQKMQTSNPYGLELLALAPNFGDMEKRLHRLMSRLRVRGEWFRYEKSFFWNCWDTVGLPKNDALSRELGARKTKKRAEREPQMDLF